MDHAFLRGLLRNDRDTMAELYDTYGGIAYGLAHRTLGATGDAEDVVQESFLALWRQAPRLDPERGIKSYLLTIVHNKAVDRLRRRGRRAEAPLDAIMALPSQADDPVEWAARIEDRELVRGALNALPMEQRQTIELTYFGGLSSTEVAERTRVPLGTVKSRLRLALNHLRSRLLEST
jgi:RNA polymerase sigma-70 factor (ECF subfamily)